jgi:hypothetical protein
MMPGDFIKKLEYNETIFNNCEVVALGNSAGVDAIGICETDENGHGLFVSFLLDNDHLMPDIKILEY